MSKLVFLLSTGCFNPPTIMHLRMMELARDHLHKLGFKVVGGAISPAHDGYGKKDLISAQHRVKMLQLALENNDWVKVSSWESLHSDGWKRTKLVVDHHQNALNECLGGQVDSVDDCWLPDTSQLRGEVGDGNIKLQIVCGADYLESFNIKDLWSHDDMLKLTQDYGFAVISRVGNDIMKTIYNNEILSAHPGNIHIVQEWIHNDISSTKIRQALQRSESIRYIVPDPVIDYISKNNLYAIS